MTNRLFRTAVDVHLEPWCLNFPTRRQHLLVWMSLCIIAGCDRVEISPYEGSYTTTNVNESSTCEEPKYPGQYRPDYGFLWSNTDVDTYEIWFNDDSDAGIAFPCRLDGTSFTCDPDVVSAGVGCGDVYRTYSVGGVWLSDEDVQGTFLFSESGTMYEEYESDPCVELCSWTFDFVAAYDP